MVRPLIDGDIIANEVGFGSQSMEGKDVIPRDWEFARDLCSKKINLICEEVGATSPPLIFLTNKPFINNELNKRRAYNDEDQQDYLENFRIAVANERAYKGRRTNVRPFHFNNLLVHLINNYDTYIVENGTEADDAMATYQCYSPPLTTIICSRDKDLRQVPGLYYSWEMGKQEGWGPIEVGVPGFLEKVVKNKVNNKGVIKPVTSYRGVGDLFLYFQMITGDSTDDIIGIMGKGDVFAYNLLKDAKTSEEARQLAMEVYVKEFGDRWEEMWNEMYNLIYIKRTI